MATYYVRKDGHDTTGNGSTELPWLTLAKAVASISTAGGHTILMGEGTYAESTAGVGYLNLNTVFSDWVTIRPETEGGVVVITDTGATSVNSVRIRTCQKFRFENLRFTPAVYKTGGSVSLSAYAMSDIYFYNCTLDIRTDTAGLAYGFYAVNNAAVAMSNITIDGCSFNVIGEHEYVHVRAELSHASGTVDAFTIKNSVLHNTGTRYAIQLKAVTNFLVDGCTVSSAGSIALAAGSDAIAAGGELPTTGTVQNCTVSSTTSHALLVGVSCDGVVITNNVIVGGDIGLVFKECANGKAYFNRIRCPAAAGGPGLYFKAATGAEAKWNKIIGSAGVGIKAAAGDGGAKCQNLTVTHNTVRMSGAGAVFSWAATGDNGGCVVDYNVYGPKGSGRFGSVRADTDVLNLAELRAAWAGYDMSDNDTHSRLLSANMILPKLIARGW
jgi:hypothetical protein